MSFKTLIFRHFTKNRNISNCAAVITWKDAREKYKNYTQNNRKNIVTALLGSVLVGTTKLDDNEEIKTTAENNAKDQTFEAGEKKANLPTFSAEEVSKHDNKNSFWVTYKHGVYDVTDFLPSHPGGEQIYNAAGLSIEPFWNVYGMHKTQEIFTLLEKYRIGNLSDDDVVEHDGDELWAKEPYRDKRLIIKTTKPFNAEIPPQYQIEHFDTPNELFYVRQHMPVPELEAESHKLRVLVKGPGDSEQQWEFTLGDLSQFPETTVRATLMCAGNRRSEMNKQVKPVKGISWAGGAVSTAVWRGVLLRDVLLRCGVDPNDVTGRHVILQGADIDATGVQFSTSIPLGLALEPSARVLLATHMNGTPLPPDHGRPLRAVVPGAPAVRSVKWLESITVSTDESDSHWHQKDYRAFNPSKTWETADFSTAPPLYSLPVTSAICDPADGDTVKVENGCVVIRGYAYSGGGAGILRVDVTGDRGATWTEATLHTEPALPRQHYAWALWQADLPISQDQQQVEIWVKATDSNFNTQPEKFDDIWNIRGILSNAYHKITVNLQQAH